MHVEISNHGKLSQNGPSGGRGVHSASRPLQFRKSRHVSSAEERIYDLFINQRYAECHGIDTMSNGNISPDLGDMWHHGHPVSPQWEGGLELDSASDCEKANVEVGTSAAQDHATENGPKDYPVL